MMNGTATGMPAPSEEAALSAVPTPTFPARRPGTRVDRGTLSVAGTATPRVAKGELAIEVKNALIIVVIIIIIFPNNIEMGKQNNAQLFLML